MISHYRTTESCHALVLVCDALAVSSKRYCARLASASVGMLG